jgi:hypothetical protein
MTTTNHETQELEFSPADWPRRAWRVVTLALAVVLVCVAVALVLLASEAASTQEDANAARLANNELRAELQCRAIPTLDFDRESTELSALIAEGLAAVATNTFDDPIAFAADVRAQVTEVNKTLNARERSFEVCAEEGDSNAASGD